LPRHIAIIMDGNGRWAQARGLPRIAGHRRGGEAVRRTVAAAQELGIPYLTLFGFSSENWRRPASEIHDLMALLRHYLRGEIAELHKNGIRLRVIGHLSRLDPDIVAMIEEAEATTRGNSAIHLTIALSYGGRDRRGGARHRGTGGGGPPRSHRGHRGTARPPSLHRRSSRSRSVDPHQRRTAHQQLFAMAMRLFRTRLHEDAMAGFFQA
jgi:hypothetical protein